MMESRYDPTSVNHELVLMVLTLDNLNYASLGDHLGANTTHEAPNDLSDGNTGGW